MDSEAATFVTAVVEPTYMDGEHAPGNCAMLQAVQLAVGETLFASTNHHLSRVNEVNSSPINSTFFPIEVQPSGGIRLDRFLSQLRTLHSIVGSFDVTNLVLLSAGPETLFASRMLVAKFPRLRIFSIMHGNVATLRGWRSRDPRRRLFDLRSAIKIACHHRIALVVLEKYIADLLVSELGLQNKVCVWENPTFPAELSAEVPWTLKSVIHLTFVGSANRGKGFGQFCQLCNEIGGDYKWSVAGNLSDDFRSGVPSIMEIVPGRPNRGDYLNRIRAADYAIMIFGDDYELTSSGSLVDCIAQLKPIITLDKWFIRELSAGYGDIGYLCSDYESLKRLLRNPALLRDSVRYATFQESLVKLRAARSSTALASTIAEDFSAVK